MIAVVQTGGKQYVVTEHTKLKIEKLSGKEGDSVKLDQVLFIGDVDGNKANFGSPLVSGGVVTAKIIKQGRAKKVRLVKFKQKVHYRRSAGHRQQFTEIQIEKIG